MQASQWQHSREIQSPMRWYIWFTVCFCLLLQDSSTSVTTQLEPASSCHQISIYAPSCGRGCMQSGQTERKGNLLLWHQFWEPPAIAWRTAASVLNGIYSLNISCSSVLLWGMDHHLLGSWFCVVAAAVPNTKLKPQVQGMTSEPARGPGDACGKLSEVTGARPLLMCSWPLAAALHTQPKHNAMLQQRTNKEEQEERYLPTKTKKEEMNNDLWLKNNPELMEDNRKSGAQKTRIFYNNCQQQN